MMQNMAKLYGPLGVLECWSSSFWSLSRQTIGERELYRKVKDHRRVHYATYSVSRVGDASIHWMMSAQD